MDETLQWHFHKVALHPLFPDQIRIKKCWFLWREENWRTRWKTLSNQADVELDMINVISAVDIAFIMSSSQAIVNWLNVLDQRDFS